jgi:hypothetical protein
MDIWVWVLVVLVVADGVERDWRSYTRRTECEEIVRAITHHRENAIKARCERREKELLYEVD